MAHEIYRISSFEKVAPFTLRVQFDDGTSQIIDFRPVLKGELYGPLQEPTLFDQVRIDPEVHTLVWPNGADFDPAILHNWAESSPALKALAEKYNLSDEFVAKYGKWLPTDESKFVGEDFGFCNDYQRKYGKPIPAWTNFDFTHGGYQCNLFNWLTKEVDKIEQDKELKAA